MALSELEIYFGTSRNARVLTPKNQDQDEESLDLSPRELKYRLTHTREYFEFKRRQDRGEEEAAMQQGFSECELAVPLLLKKHGYPVELKDPRNSKRVEKASVKGVILHQAWILFEAALDGRGSHEVERMFPSGAPQRAEPYKIVDKFSIPPDATLSETETVLYEAWDVFRKDPNLTESVPEPLFNNVGVQNWKEEWEIRQSEEVLGAGQKLASFKAKAKYSEKENESESALVMYPRQYELLMIGNLLCGLQISVRLDSIWAQSKEGKKRSVSYNVADLKTGKKRERDGIGRLIHDLQSGIMITLSERFGGRFLRNGYIRPQGKAYILNKVDQHSPVGWGTVRLGYQWFSDETGEVEEENLEIEDRTETNEIIDWYGEASKVFKGYLNDYFSRGIDRPNAGERPKGKKVIKPHPDGLVQGELNFSTNTVQQEFEEISEKIDSNNPENKPLQVGFVGEPIGTCDCGGSIGNFYKYIGGKGTGMVSRVVVSEKCMGCGAVYKKHFPKPVSKK